MRNALSVSLLLTLCVFSGVGELKAQEPDASKTRLPAPTIFPAPGTYFNTTSLALFDQEPGAEIHYTWDGTEPNASSAVFNPSGVLFIGGVYDGNKGLTTGYTLRAVALKAGAAPSDIATFSYAVERRDRTAYLSEEVAPGVRMIRDSDNDKMFLVRGANRYALIDSGQGRGALREYISQFTGGMPLVTIWTHSHGDHIGQADQFIEGSDQYVGADDREATAELLKSRGARAEAIAQHLHGVDDGAKVSLGDRELEIVSVPGHTPGSIVVLDPASGILFTGDSIGNNSFLPPDVLWMQWVQKPLDHYFAAIETARSRLQNRVKLIMTGHNDKPLVGTAYLDNLERALQRAMDEGEGALVPSYRPPGGRQIVVGDRITDPNWFGINVNPQTFLPASADQIASLVAIDLRGAALATRFAPDEHDYRASVERRNTVSIAARPASSRVARLTINGKPAKPGAPVKVSIGKGQRVVPIVVTAHDGQTTQTYRVTFN
jgi:glyoxylase-like metal-dependent hydrolase (beta-lactamase superfamily II)